MSATVLEAADKVRFNGEFASPELEAAFQQRHEREQRFIAHVIIVSAAVCVLAMGVLDYGLFPAGPQLYGLWAVRVGYFFLAAAGFCVIRSIRRAWFGRAVLTWMLTGVALQLYAGTVWPPGHVEMRVTASLAVLMAYCILPLSFRLQVVAAMMHTAAALAVDFWLNPSPDRSSALGDVCWLGIVNVLGVVMSQRVHVRQRLLFAAMLRQSELSAKLGKALAEVRTLRGMIQVCAWCRKVHTDDDRWQQLESYVREHSHAELTHGICPKCLDGATGESWKKSACGSGR